MVVGNPILDSSPDYPAGMAHRAVDMVVSAGPVCGQPAESATRQPVGCRVVEIAVGVPPALLGYIGVDGAKFNGIVPAPNAKRRVAARLGYNCRFRGGEV